MRYGVFGPNRRKGAEVDYDNLLHVSACLRQLADMTELVAGGGRGIETLAERYAVENNLPFRKIKPDFNGTGGEKLNLSQAFDARNMQIMQYCDKLVVFWDGVSSIGTVLRNSMVLNKTVTLFPLI